jgi:hypothetical protein
LKREDLFAEEMFLRLLLLLPVHEDIRVVRKTKIRRMNSKKHSPPTEERIEELTSSISVLEE